MKLRKAERTRQRIIEASAPLFNSKGFSGTTMTDILKATGLTKGGVYGNFAGKDEIALEAFEYNKDMLFRSLHEKVAEKSSPLEQLHAFFRSHGEIMQQFPGGCPLLNTATEADDTHPVLKKRVKAALFIWINYLKRIIQQGIDKGEIKSSVDPELSARTMLSMLEGAVFMGKLMERPEAYLEIIRQIRRMIDAELAT